MKEHAPIGIIAAADALGESIVWDSRRHILWWTDIHGRRLHRYDWASRTMRVHETPERVGSFGLVAGSAALITAFESGIALYDPCLNDVTWIARPQAEVKGVRFNDGRVDRRGRFWCGTMVEEGTGARSGSLYSIDSSGTLVCHLRGVQISNGLCMSPDGSKLYFTDSPSGIIRVYDLIEPQGVLGQPERFAHSREGTVPDGATVDAEGCVWSASWGGGCVVRYTPDGREDRTITVPTTQPTCPCFGGPDLDLLFVTTARHGLDRDTLQREPHAGDVFIYRPGVRGLPEAEYGQSG